MVYMALPERQVLVFAARLVERLLWQNPANQQKAAGIAEKRS